MKLNVVLTQSELIAHATNNIKSAHQAIRESIGYPDDFSVEVSVAPQEPALAPLPFTPTVSVKDLTMLLNYVQIRNRSNFIPAIKLFRQATGCGLKDAKDVIDTLIPVMY